MSWPVQEVDPKDLKYAWSALQEFQQKRSTAQRSIDPFPAQVVLDLQRVCLPNLFAICYRLTQLNRLRQFRKAKRQPLPGMKRGKPTDAIFKAFAFVPIAGREFSDPPRRDWPFDVDELVRLIQKESGEPAPQRRRRKEPIR